MGEAADRAADLIARALIGSVMALPYERRVPAMGALLRRALGPLTGQRRRALDNLRLVRPRWTPERQRAVADGVLDNFGRTLVEMYSRHELTGRLAGAPLLGGGLPHLEEARAAGRPVLFVTGHFGNHEAPRYALAARGFVVGGLYRASDNRHVDAHYAQTMRDVSGPLFAKGRPGLLGFARHLRGGGMATILFDLDAASGAPIPFLGRPARTATTAAELALRLDALVLPYFGVRRPDGLSFDLRLEEPVPHGAPLAMMEEMTRRLEAQVEARPEQWFWVHRRWREPGRRRDVGGGVRAPAPPP